jgi:adenylate kinase family enzyme
MKKLTMLVGPPGSGKSTMARAIREASEGTIYVNQDSQGKSHLALFEEAVIAGKNIVVDRMNFDLKQRTRYLAMARDFKYDIEIRVLHQPYDVCLERMLKRENHETIKNEESARGALHLFFTRYERVEDGEADKVVRIWPEGDKPEAIICDLDGTLADCSHRRHFVRREGKKDWNSFFQGISEDTPNKWCVDILHAMRKQYRIVYCSGRAQEFHNKTKAWLSKYGLWHICKEDLYMRYDGDFRQDFIVKEILLDFEILTRFKPYFMIDDRKQVVDLWRRRGFTCLACDEGDF